MSSSWRNVALLLIGIIFIPIQQIYGENSWTIVENELKNTDNKQIIKNIDNDLSNDNEKYRLPITVIPSHYTITLQPYLITNNFTFDGIVIINATASINGSNKIVLHIDDIECHEVNLTVNKRPVEVKHDRDEQYHFLIIQTSELIIVESEVIIKIKYTGKLNAEMRGFYRSSYTNAANEKKWLAATHFEPVGARKMFPCFDEPALKATFQISVIRSKNYTTISNTKLSVTKKYDEDNFIDTFEKTKIMSTYLVALVVSDFDVKSINDSYSVYSRKNAINQTIYAASIMKSITDYFGKVLDYPYQLSKLDMIALPDFVSGAMENWGLITYRESNILYNVKNSPIITKQSIASVITHEISHQWFGNLVTPQWWSYAWLSEGFARYYQYYGTAKIKSNWGLENQFVVEQLQNSFGLDGLPSSHPMTHNVYSPSEISNIFDQISYGKGGSILRMLENIIGTDLFYASLRDYLKRREYNYGTPEYLFDAIQTQVDKNGSIELNVTKMMNSWTTQSGFPVVNVYIENKTVWLSQNRFLLRNPDGIDINKLWSIPITYATKSSNNFFNTTPVMWLTDKNSAIHLSDDQFKPNDWIIFNVQEVGYYRVNYDIDLWNRIIMTLKSEDFLKIHELNRASLLDDVLNLARAGLTDYYHALNATQYLIQETNYIPWKAALNSLSYLDKKLAGKDIHNLFKIHILTILTPIYKKLDFNEKISDTHYDKLLRRNIINWACEFELKDCIDKSVKLFANWKSDITQLVPVNLRMTVYCTAIKHGTVEDFKFLWKKYLMTDTPAEKSHIINALGCSKNEILLEQLMSNAINKNNSIFRYQDITNIFASVYTSGLFGAQCALKFVINNYDNMHEYFGNHDDVVDIIGSISSQLTTKDLVVQLQNFVEDQNGNSTIPINLLKYHVTRAHEELTWYDKNSPGIFKWLDTTYPSSDYRLPKSIDPITYSIILTPYLDNNNFTFDGTVSIEMKPNKNISSIVLHTKKLTINSIKVSDDNEKLDISSYSINSTTDKLTIYLTKTVNNETILTVTIEYSGILNNDMVGFYRSSYEDENGIVHWLATTQFQKFGARQAFPCFDEPAFKAKFTIIIERPNHYHTLSNMPLRESSGSNKVNHTLDVYEESEHMSSYLVAFVISDFSYLSNGNFKVWSRPNAIDYAKDALVIGKKSLDFLEKYTGINYPIGKMDLIAIPDFAAGAMENWGLVTFREYGLLTSKNITSAIYMRYMATTIAHELVHMWFGDLVTCDWWEYLWLNEGFAEYLEYLVIDSINPEWNMQQHFISYELQVALLKDSFSYMRPMNNKMENPFDDGKDFTSVAYQKSASVIHMMHRAFGNDIFAKGLHTYLDQNKYSTGKPEYLWSALQTHVNQSGDFNVTSVAAIMNSWTNQPGYPVVHASFSQKILKLTQERFLVTGKNDTSPKLLYWVPITIACKSNPNFNNASIIYWFGRPTDMIHQEQLPDQWFIINIQQAGYYRVNYDTDNWNRLIEALNENNFGGISEINRAQIIDDVLNLARAEYVLYDLALTITQYLTKELHHLPWKAFFSAYSYLYERFDGHVVGNILHKYVINLTDNVYKNVGFNEASNDTQLIKTNRQLILSWICKLNHSDCVEVSKKLFSQWRNDTEIFISPDAKPAVICTALKYGDYDDWNFAFEKYNKSNIESEKVVILNALGCTQNNKAINQYLNTIFSRDGSIRDQNVALAFTSIYSAGKFGVNASMKYLINNYTTIYKYYGNWNSVANLFSNVASKFSTKAEIDELRSFINGTAEELKEIRDSLKVTVSESETDLEFFNKHGTVISNLLTSSVTSTPSTIATSSTTTSNNETTPPNSATILNEFITIFITIPILLYVTFH